MDQHILTAYPFSLHSSTALHQWVIAATEESIGLELTAFKPTACEQTDEHRGVEFLLLNMRKRSEVGEISSG